MSIWSHVFLAIGPFGILVAWNEHGSRGKFPILSRDPSFWKTTKNGQNGDRFLKRMMAEKNGKGINP